MKTNRLFITAVLIITGSFIMNISAQDALKAIAKKCENMENVDVSVVRSRDKETKKVNNYVMSITFEKNESLKKEILAAFQKERVNADHEVEDRRNGRIRELLLRFGSSSYSLSERTNGRFSFSVIENYGSKDGAFFHNGFHLNNIRPLQAQMDMVNQKLESIDWEELSENLEKGFANFNSDFEIDMKNFEIDMKNLEIDMNALEKEAK